MPNHNPDRGTTSDPEPSNKAPASKAKVEEDTAEVSIDWFLNANDVAEQERQQGTTDPDLLRLLKPPDDKSRT